MTSAQELSTMPAPSCKDCGEAMHYEYWNHGWSTFHTRTGEFLCDDNVKPLEKK